MAIIPEKNLGWRAGRSTIVGPPGLMHARRNRVGEQRAKTRTDRRCSCREGRCTPSVPLAREDLAIPSKP